MEKLKLISPINLNSHNVFVQSIGCESDANILFCNVYGSSIEIVKERTELIIKAVEKLNKELKNT